MRYYIFRNNTLEPLFGNLDARYSGYGDISSLEEERIAISGSTKSLSGLIGAVWRRRCYPISIS